MCKIFSALFRANEGASRPGILPVAALFFMLVFAFSVFVDAGYAQVNSGKIAGRVTDGRGNPLPAANVIIGETAMGAATDNNGEYVITKVPAGSYNVKVNYIGYEQNIQEVQVRVDDVVRADFIMDERQVVEGEEVTVYGEITRGQAKALSMQQNAVGIEHVVSHEIIRRFPDETAGEALRRMPGVSAIDYSQGVPSSLRVRAMSDDKNKVFINGMAAPGGALAMIPSNILESVSLSKVITPDMDADAIGGAVNFELQVAPSEPQFFARAQGGINTLEFGPENRANNNYSFFVKGGRRFMNDKIGVLAGGALFGDRRGVSFESMRYTDDGSNIVRHRFSKYDVQRYRTMGYFNVDYTPNESNQYYLLVSKGRYRRDEARGQIKFDRREKKMPEGEIEKSIRHYNRPHDLTFAKFNGLNRLGNVKLEYSAAWFRDESIQDDQIEAAWDGEQPSMADLTKDEFENLTMNSSFNGVLDFGGLESSWSDDQSDHYEVKADMSFPINASRTSELKVGVKREGNYNQQRRMRTKADLAEGETWQITDEWPLLFENINSSTVKNLNLDGPFSYEGMDPTDHTSSNDNSAEVTAGYIMNSTAWLHQRLHTTVGVRVEHIKNSFTEMWSGKSGSASYTDFFPAFIAKYNITEKTNLRGSITRTQSRLAPISIAPIDREERNPPPYAISRGNPDLEPTTALSYDLMFERYTSRLGYFSVGVFAKQLDNNIMTLETEEMYKGREYEIYFPINSGDTSIEGVELATYQKLHFLGVPALNWFGVQANWTYINMEGEDRKILAQMPKHVINFALTYDNPDIGFSGTVGLNWNGMVFEKYEKGVPIWNTPIHRLDASANYALTDNIRVYVRGKNLLDSPGDPEWEYKPTLDETRLHEIKYYGRWFSAGIDYSL